MGTRGKWGEISNRIVSFHLGAHYPLNPWIHGRKGNGPVSFFCFLVTTGPFFRFEDFFWVESEDHIFFAYSNWKGMDGEAIATPMSLGLSWPLTNRPMIDSSRA